MGFKDSFLEPEVRCGFYIPSSVKQAWAAQLEVLEEIDKLCEKHKIKYFADWGTLLGAVRHGGYVPWDDDLDIVMLREDYDRFLQVAHELPEGFDVHSFRSHPDHWLFLSNVVSKSRICFEREHLERFRGFPYISGLDIFVLDYVSPDPDREHERDLLAEYIIAVADDIYEGELIDAPALKALSIIEDRTKKSLPASLLQAVKNEWKKPGQSASAREKIAGLAVADFNLEDATAIHQLRVWLYNLAEKWFGYFKESECQELTQLFPFGLSGHAMRLPKEYYQEQIRIPFEYTTIPVPIGYAEMLSRKYGDYMKLVKNAGGHDYPYFKKQKESLQKVLDFEMPGYKIHKEDLRREVSDQSGSYKALLRDALGQLKAYQVDFFALLESGAESEEEVERLFSLLADSQQLATDMGTLCESVKGEKCKVIPVLETYCEELYLLYNVLTGESQEPFDTDCLGATTQELEEALETHILSRREMVFLPFDAKYWESFDALWKAAMLTENVDVYVVALPYFYKNYDGSLRDMQYQLENYPEKLHVIHIDDFDLELYHPEVIFSQNPYDSYDEAISLPPAFYSKRLQSYSEKVVYVPYFQMDEFTEGDERYYENMESYLCRPGIVAADLVLAPSQQMKKVMIQKLCDFAGEDTRSIWEDKISVYGEEVCEGLGIKFMPSIFENDDVNEYSNECLIKNSVISDSEDRDPKYKTLFYYTGIGQMIQNGEKELLKMQKTFDLVESVNAQNASESEVGEKKQLHILLWQDDNFLQNLIRLRPQLYEDYMLLIRGYEEKEWFSVCRDEEIERAILRSDAYYGDTGPYLLRFSGEGKPVMVQNVDL